MNTDRPNYAGLDPLGDALVRHEQARRQEDKWFRGEYQGMFRILAAAVAQAGGELRIDEIHLLALRGNLNLTFIRNEDTRSLVIKLEQPNPGSPP